MHSTHRPGLSQMGAQAARAVSLLALLTLAPACSQSQCQSMKADGSAFASIFCGGSGDDAPEPVDAGTANACSDIKQVMPEFFALLDEQKLTGIQTAVEQIGAPTCADPINQRHCNEDTVCAVGVCDTVSDLCPCQNFYNPLGDLLESLFSGLAVISSPTSVAEPGAVAPSKCVDAAAAEALPASERNSLCEIRRTLDFLVNQDGGDKLFNDPAINNVIVALLNYVQGNYTPPVGQTATPHYDLFTTLGLIAQNPGVCSPANTYDLLDKALIYLTPAVGTRLVGDVTALLNDPTTVNALSSLGGGTDTDPAARRHAVVTILLALLPSIQAAQTGAAAITPVENLLVNLLKLYGTATTPSTYSQQFQDEVRLVLVDLGCADPNNTGTCSTPADPIMGGGVLGPDAGLFPDIANPQTGLLQCLTAVDPTGNALGAAYDLITLQSTAAGGTIDIATLLGAVQEVLALDPTGQTNRTLRFVIESIAKDPTAVDSIDELLAQVFTPQIAQELIPPLSLIIQNQVVGEILSLLQDILYSCSPPAAAQMSSPGH